MMSEMARLWRRNKCYYSNKDAILSSSVNQTAENHS